MASKGDKDVVLDLAKYSDQRVRVKFQVYLKVFIADMYQSCTAEIKES